MSSVDCKELTSDVTIRWLVEHGAEIYCSYCGYVFDGVPKLPTKCPKCRRRLTKLCMPIFEPKLRKKL